MDNIDLHSMAIAPLEQADTYFDEEKKCIPYDLIKTIFLLYVPN